MRIGISGQRYYDADTGRFITEDSYLGDQGEPPSLHRYLYAYSNPLVYVDLEGNASIREMLGLDEKSVYAAAANDGSWWGAAKYAAKATGYTVWNGVTGGFLGRQDARQEKVDRGQISESDFWKGTGIDATASVATQVVAGGVLGKAATAGGLVRNVVTGAAVSGGTSLVEQTAQVATYQATDGRLGQVKIDVGQVLQSAESGALVAGGLYGAGKVFQQVRWAMAAGKAGSEAALTGEGLAANGTTGKFGRFNSADEFSAESFTRYQRYTDEAYAATLKAEARGRLVIPEGMPRETIIGQRTDAYARSRMRRWLQSEGISEGPGHPIQLNRWMRDPTGGGA
ncbi:hypothetical protein GMSM_24680 [Geomonas sp. Red276]